jgi:hypothetical protein
MHLLLSIQHPSHCKVGTHCSLRTEQFRPLARDALRTSASPTRPLLLPIIAHESTSRTPPPFFHPSHTSVAIGTFPRMDKARPRRAQFQSCRRHGSPSSSAVVASTASRRPQFAVYRTLFVRFLSPFALDHLLCSSFYSARYLSPEC